MYNNLVAFCVFVFLLPELQTYKIIETGARIDDNSGTTEVDMNPYNKLRLILRKNGSRQDEIDFQAEKFSATIFTEGRESQLKLKDFFPSDQFIGQPINNRTEEDVNVSKLDSWSIIWYIASFGGLIAFFLLVSCSEWCCRRHARNNCSNRNSIHPNLSVNDTPPPPYDQFAPPSYDSLTTVNEKREFDVYVVPVCTFSTILEQADDQPPSYTTAARVGGD